MSEMIERVARALYLAYAGPEPLTPWERISARDQEMHRKLARAAIEAMLEPTEEMLDAAATCDRGQPRRRSVRSILLAEHHAMISAALRDSTG